MKLKLLLYTFVFYSAINFAQLKKIKVLFLGNSYTYVNNLPQLIYDVALANGDTLAYDSNCPGGYTFNNHFNDLTSISKINTNQWKYVVLQAQSQEPSFPPSQVSAQTLPYAIKLDSVVKKNNICSQSVYYETWGRKNGDASNCASYPPLCTYSGMQDRLKQSYKLFADTTHSIMSPVGEAWRKSIATSPTLDLYSSDQSHPSLAGSCLTAFVFYEVLFGKSVLTNTYSNSGVAGSDLSFLKQIAHDVVNDSLSTWNIGKFTPCIVTKIKTEDAKDSFKLFPNPVKNTLSISNANNSFSEMDMINIVDILGKTKLIEPLFNAKSIDVSALESGIYFIEIISKKTLFNKMKFIKE
ncbi:MAG: T9SS type A sorting domain-containing protein [Bacteroidetes bacterium]|nr:T9SS type A sorting domain-containing protein [Bacteroidota bacterium]